MSFFSLGAVVRDFSFGGAKKIQKCATHEKLTFVHCLSHSKRYGESKGLTDSYCTGHCEAGWYEYSLYVTVNVNAYAVLPTKFALNITGNRMKLASLVTKTAKFAHMDTGDGSAHGQW